MTRLGRFLVILTGVVLVGLLVYPTRTTGQHHRYGTTYPSVAQFGSSYGPTTDETQAVYDQELDAEAKYCGGTSSENPPCLFRGAVHWDPTSGTWSQSKYDQFITDAWARGIMFLPEIHTSHTLSGGSGYIDPLTCTGTTCGATAFEAAVTSFAERYGPNGAYTLAHPGFPGITRYEVWNEPNTPTGNIELNKVAMPASEFDTILHAESTALQTAANAKGWIGQLQIACCALGNLGTSAYPYDLAYLKAMVAADSSVWSYISPSSAKPGVITTHQYMQGDPASCDPTSASGPKCIKYETTIRSYLDSQGQTAVGLGITEGGFSGIDDSNTGTVNGGPTNCTSEPSDVTTETNQSSWDSSAISWLQANPSLDFQFLTFYRIIDGAPDPGRGACTTTGGAARWQSGLGPANSNGTLKPWGTAYKAIIAAAQGTPTPPGGCSTYNVVTDGADNTGTSDSTSAFNTAISAASAQGSAATPCIVTVPAGTYRVNGVDLASNVTVQFAGSAIEDTSGGAGPLFTLDGGLSNVTMEPAPGSAGWVLDLDPAATGGLATACGICIYNADGFTINGATTIENQSVTAGTTPSSADAAIQLSRTVVGGGPSNGTLENITGLSAPYSGGPVHITGGDHLTLLNIVSTGGDAVDLNLNGSGLLGVDSITATNVTCYRGNAAVTVVAHGNPATNILLNGVLATSCNYTVKWNGAVDTGSSATNVTGVYGTAAQNNAGGGGWTVGNSQACTQGALPVTLETCSGF